MTENFLVKFLSFHESLFYYNKKRDTNPIDNPIQPTYHIYFVVKKDIKLIFPFTSSCIKLRTMVSKFLEISEYLCPSVCN